METICGLQEASYPAKPAALSGQKLFHLKELTDPNNLQGRPAGALITVP